MLLQISFLFSLRFVTAINYCNLCEEKTHVLCRYPNEGPGQLCVDYKQHNLTDLLKAYIVNVHNDIRNHIASGQEKRGKLGNQPSAADMMHLQWDEELAIIAQRWADQCFPPENQSQHDECKRTEKFESVSQNILTAVTTDNELPDLAFLILNWYNEVDHVVTADIEHFAGVKRAKYAIGHYTQLVWAKTKYVGCGLAIYGDRNNAKKISKKTYYNRLVCNYAPAGNVLEKQVYEIGAPCSKCSHGMCNDVRKNLCQGSKNFTKFKRHDLDLQKNQTIQQTKHTSEVHFLQNINETQDQLIGSLKESSSVDSTTRDVSVVNNKYVPRKRKTKRKNIIYVKEDEILFFNVTYKKTVGLWYNGYCRCDIIQRSSSKTNILPPFMLILNLIIYMNTIKH